MLIIQGKFNRLNDPVDIILHLIIPKADYFVPQCLKILASLSIIFELLQMLASIKFDD